MIALRALQRRRRRRRPIEILAKHELDAPAESEIVRLALPSPHRLPRRTSRLRPDEVANAWTGRLKIMAAFGNRTARSHLRRLATARRAGDQAGGAAAYREAQAQYLEAREIVAAFEAQRRADAAAAWSAAEAAGVELDGLKAIAARGAARVRGGRR